VEQGWVEELTLKRNDNGAVNPGNNLHVSGLARSITKDDLDRMFGKTGKVCSRYTSLEKYSMVL